MQHWKAGLATYPLSPTQLKDVLGIVTTWSLDPNDFEWSLAYTRSIQIGPGREHPTVDRLTHKPTGYWFLFDFDTRMRHNGYFRPAHDKPEAHTVADTWEEQERNVNSWARYVEREYGTPDVWSLIGEQTEIGALPSGVENTLFTEEEQKRIETVLHAALARAHEKHELTEEQDRTLEEKVDELLDASRRLGRRDWQRLFIGLMVEVMVQEALPPGFVRDVLGFALRGLMSVFGGVDFTPQLPRPG